MIIWLASYPKSGNTWIRLFLNLLLFSKNSSLNINDIKNATEAFITSATQHVMPVVKVDKMKIGSGKPGPNAQVFKNVYMESLKLV